MPIYKVCLNEKEDLAVVRSIESQCVNVFADRWHCGIPCYTCALDDFLANFLNSGETAQLLSGWIPPNKHKGQFFKFFAKKGNMLTKIFVGWKWCMGNSVSHIFGLLKKKLLKVKNSLVTKTCKTSWKTGSFSNLRTSTLKPSTPFLRTVIRVKISVVIICTSTVPQALYLKYF